MKKVFTSANDVIHVFAQQTQEEGRSSNVFFRGSKIYSYGYHYLLGEFIDSKTIVINDVGYSSETGKHIRSLRYGTRQYKQFFITECDLGKVHSEILHLKDKLGRAKKPEMYTNNIVYLFNSLNDFINYTKNKSTKKDVRYKEIHKIVKNLSTDSEKYRLSLVRLEAARKKKEAKKVEETLKKFYNYEVNSFRIGNEDFLRLSSDKSHVETSQGIKVPSEDAHQLYLLICKKVDVRGHRIAGYSVNSINGTLKIGCHNINMKSVHKVGGQL